MKTLEPTPFITQSPFFSKIFDTAVFDRELKIYFPRPIELEALTIYGQLRLQSREAWHFKSVFVMIFDSELSLRASIQKDTDRVSPFFLFWYRKCPVILGLADGLKSVDWYFLNTLEENAEKNAETDRADFFYSTQNVRS